MKKKASSIVIGLLVAICLSYTVTEGWQGPDGKGWSRVIGADGYGYYAYLPSVFIYHSFDFTKTFHAIQEVHPEYSYDYACVPMRPGDINKPQDKTLDPVPIGTAILMLPFFLLAYFLSFITGANLNGYHFLFQASVSIAGLFYLTLGLIYLRKLLKSYNVNEWGICITLCMLVLATNLFYYAAIETSLSHIYSFGLTAFFLYYAKRGIETFRVKHLALMAASFIVLVLIRPTNVLTVLMVPFMAGTFAQTKLFFIRLFSSPRILITLVLIVFSVLFLQLLAWHTETGRWFVWGYPEEGFDFKHSHLAEFLFSFRKGWFIYTPVMLVFIVYGLIALFRQSVFKFSIILLYLFTSVFILASWSDWAYGASYGSRPVIDYYACFCLLPAFWYSNLKFIRKILTLLFIALFTAVNMVQIYQYTHAIIPIDNSKMNGELFWKMFLETEPIYAWAYNEPPDTNAYQYDPKYEFKNDFEYNAWGNNINLTSIITHRGNYAAYVSEKNNTSPTFSIAVNSLPSNATHVLVSLWVYATHRHDNATLVMTVTENGKIYNGAGHQLCPYILHFDEWNRIYWLADLPKFKSPADSLHVYVYENKGVIMIDDVDIKFATDKH